MEVSVSPDLRLLSDQIVLREHEIEALRLDVRAGLEALEQGDCDEYDAGDIRSLAVDIKARGRERLASLARNSGG